MERIKAIRAQTMQAWAFGLRLRVSWLCVACPLHAVDFGNAEGRFRRNIVGIHLGEL